MNIYDISKKAGVSIATVSRVINGSSNVSEKTKAKVLAVIEEVGYTPNAFARGLGLNTMQTVGILCADSSDPYMANAISVLEKELRVCGYNIFLCCTGYDLEAKQQSLQFLVNKQVDALIFIGSNFINEDQKDNEYIKNVAKSIPVMVINGLLSSENIYSILADDYTAVYDATKAFIEKGRKRIVYLHNNLTYSIRQKIRGYEKAMNEYSLAVHTVLIEYTQKSIKEVKEQLLNVHELIKDADVIICANDTIAVGVLKYAKEKGLRIPTDVEILGHNNSYITLCTDPELSSIDNQLEELCKSCVSTLMGVFNGDTVPLRLVFPSVLVQRQTTSLPE